MKEIWKPIAWYEGLYEVSNLGKVKSLKRIVKCKNGQFLSVRERILKGGLDKGKYRLHVLMNQGKRKTHKEHRIVANAFLINPNNYPIINHKDSNPNNNKASNLEWCSHSHNVIHAVKKGRFRGKISDEKTIAIYEMYKEGENTEKIAKLFDVNVNTISRIATGKRHGHLGLKPIFRQPTRRRNK